MAPINGEFDIVVVAGADADRGVRVRVGRQPVVIGRGPGAGLALSDARVSREHAQAVASDTSVAFVTLPEARRLLVYRGERVDRAIVEPGGELQIGDTLLRVEESRPAVRRSDARTLLTGEAEDVRASAALYSLSDALRRCLNRSAIERAVNEWVRSVPLRAVEAHLRADDDSSDAAERGLVDDEVVVHQQGATESMVVVTLHGAQRMRLQVRYALPPHRIAESLQRLLFVAAMVISSRLSAVQVLSGVLQDRDCMRVAAFGSSTSFIGVSKAAHVLEERISRLSRADVTVLLSGETGTGKTFVARLLHERSPRANGPFRTVNCAALPESLIEAELFGTEKGAFTGASAARPGLLEAAANGTVFLDEIGELSLSGQSKLLRVIEERRFERLGSTKTLAFHAKVVAATNRDLAAMVKEGRFREDFYYRICVHTIAVPPLRERRDDIAALTDQFLRDLGKAHGRWTRTLSPEATQALLTYRWPGNVRELRNAIEAAIVNSDGEVVEANALPDALLAGRAVASSDCTTVTLPADHAWLDERNFEAAMTQARGNVTKAAELLGMNRVSLHKRLRRKGRQP